MTDPNRYGTWQERILAENRGRPMNEILDSFKEDFLNLLNEAKMLLNLDEYNALIEWIENRI